MDRPIQVQVFPSDFIEVNRVVDTLRIPEKMRCFFEEYEIHVRELSDEQCKCIKTFEDKIVWLHQMATYRIVRVAENNSLYPFLPHWILCGINVHFLFERCWECLPTHVQKEYVSFGFFEMDSVCEQYFWGLAHNLAMREYPEFGEQIAHYCKQQFMDFISHQRNNVPWQCRGYTDLKVQLLQHLGQEIKLTQLRHALSEAGHKAAFTELNSCRRGLVALWQERYRHMLKEYGLVDRSRDLIRVHRLHNFFEDLDAFLHRLYYDNYFSVN